MGEQISKLIEDNDRIRGQVAEEFQEDLAIARKEKDDAMEALGNANSQLLEKSNKLAEAEEEMVQLLEENELIREQVSNEFMEGMVTIRKEKDDAVEELNNVNKELLEKTNDLEGAQEEIAKLLE